MPKPPGDYRAVLLDIEGTTTSIDFVYEVLFPYARRELPGFLERTWGEPETRAAVEALTAQAETDILSGLEEVPPVPADDPDDERRAAAVRNALWQMDLDRKTTALKRLQGLVWDAGYAAGALRGHVYEDVPRALAAWKERGVPVYIYSSGSVAAQKLLFGSSEAGDLCELLAGHFDTTTGPKRDAQSYRRIAELIGLAPRDVVFVTDSLDEAWAASAAGMDTCLSMRPGNPELPEHPFPELGSLDPLVAAAR
ncbi:MAG: acireductone synthase [Deltaproteobacteria bacterium]|nr:acireductone synthase [Deltaproteobacteria bacterium]MCB9786485.1 acireductone synthase [Deltaproteobacteria bacterium]